MLAPAISRAMAIRLSALYAAIFAFFGLNVPFWPLWLGAHGLGAAAIGTALAVASATRLVAQPALGHVADRHGTARLIAPVAALAAAGFALFAAIGGVGALAPVLAVTALAWVFAGPLIPFTDATTLAAPVAYGRVRLWGSLAFLGANLGGGVLVGRFGAGAVLWAQVAALAAAAMAAAGLHRTTLAPPSRPAAAATGLGTLARAPMVWLFLAASALTNATHGMYYGFASLDWQARGFSPEMIGLLWAVGVLAEVGLFWRWGASASPLVAKRLMILGGAGAALRWSAMAGAPGLSPTIALQTLHALTYGAMHLGAMIVMRRAVPPTAATAAQGGYTAVVDGAVIGLAAWVSGPLWAAHGPRAYLAMALLGAGGALAATVFAARWHGGPLAAQRAR